MVVCGVRACSKSVEGPGESWRTVKSGLGSGSLLRVHTLVHRVFPISSLFDCPLYNMSRRRVAYYYDGKRFHTYISLYDKLLYLQPMWARIPMGPAMS